MLPVGTIVGKYCVQRHLGSGSFGAVYRATELTSGKIVALKVCRSPNPEYTVLTQLQHSAIVSGLDKFADACGDVTVMNFIDGIPLASLLEVVHLRSRRGLRVIDVLSQLPAEKQTADQGDWSAVRSTQLFTEFGCRLTLQIAAALSHAHGRKIFHRDVKPENILVTREGNAVLIDWGVAAAAGEQPDVTGGTLAYLSTAEITRMAGLRENDDARACDAREAGCQADIFALGVVLHELTTGELPYPVPVVDGSVVAAAREALPGRQKLSSLVATNKSIPAGLRQIIARCLTPRTTANSASYASMQQLADDLQQYVDGQPLAHTAETIPTRLARHWHRYGRLIRVAAGLVICGLIPLAIDRTWTSRQLADVAAFREQLSTGAENPQELPISVARKLFDSGVLPDSDAIGRRRAELCHGLGAAFLKQKNLPAAVDLLTEACRRDPSDGDAWNDLGAALFESGQFSKAITAFDRSLLQDGDHATVLSNRGATRAAMNQPTAARRDFLRALEIHPSHARARRYLQLLDSI